MACLNPRSPFLQLPRMAGWHQAPLVAWGAANHVLKPLARLLEMFCSLPVAKYHSPPSVSHFKRKWYRLPSTCQALVTVPLARLYSAGLGTHILQTRPLHTHQPSLALSQRRMQQQQPWHLPPVRRGPVTPLFFVLSVLQGSD